MFERFNVPAMYVASTGHLAAYESGRHSAITLDVGDGVANMRGVIGGPFPTFRGKFYVFPAFRIFFSCFPAYRHFSLSFGCFPQFFKSAFRFPQL